MLAELRAATTARLQAAGVTVIDTDGAAQPVEIWPHVPEDVTALPCLVVGYPESSPARETAVFDRTLTVYVLGRRVDAGDPEGELVVLTDSTFAALGGSNGVKQDGQHLTPTNVTHRTVSVAGVDHDAYLIGIESPYADC